MTSCASVKLYLVDPRVSMATALSLPCRSSTDPTSSSCVYTQTECSIGSNGIRKSTNMSEQRQSTSLYLCDDAFFTCSIDNFGIRDQYKIISALKSTCTCESETHGFIVRARNACRKEQVSFEIGFEGGVGVDRSKIRREGVPNREASMSKTMPRGESNLGMRLGEKIEEGVVKLTCWGTCRCVAKMTNIEGKRYGENGEQW